jgi:hypothetical protein
MGNLAEQSFDETWNSPAYGKLRGELTTGNYREARIKCPAVVSRRASDPMAFQEVLLPAFNDLLRLFTERVRFSENVAMLCNKSLAQYYTIKPEYDLTTGDGVTPEKIERWKKWYAKTLQIRDGFDAGSL